MSRRLLFPLLLCGCATLPEHPVERALYSDLDTLVSTRQRIAWVADRFEVENLASAAMRSTCAVAPERRRALRTWLDGRVAEEGGSGEAVWRAAGEDLRAARTILTLERVRALLDYTDEHAAADCPFWLEPDTGFSGVHAATGRFVLMAESMGSAQLVLRSEDFNLGGHGLLRILPAVGLSDRFTIASGIEAGGSSTFPRDGDTRSLAAAWVGGLPLLFRVVALGRTHLAGDRRGRAAHRRAAAVRGGVGWLRVPAGRRRRPAHRARREPRRRGLGSVRRPLVLD